MSGDPNLDLASQPHDAFFKDFFSEVAHAAAFFQEHLPPHVAATVGWDSLRLVPGSFVKRSLRQAHSDLLFSAQCGGALKSAGQERELLLYLVFEHQTSIDPAMPLRLLAYQVEILLEHYDKRRLPLPPVLCYVLHQGPKRWTVSERFEDLFALRPEDGSAAFLDFVPKFRHALLDLTRIDPAESEEDSRLRVALRLMKLARQARMAEFFEWLDARFEEHMRRLPDTFLPKALFYALHAQSDLDVERLARRLQGNSNLKTIMMSAAEQLRDEGRAEVMSVAEQLIAKGQAEVMSAAEQLRDEGRAEGSTQGMWIGRTQLLEEMLGEEVTPREELAELSLETLEARYAVLRSRYQATFKNGGETPPGPRVY